MTSGNVAQGEFGFETALRSLLTAAHQPQLDNTPEYVLAGFMLDSLDGFVRAVTLCEKILRLGGT